MTPGAPPPLPLWPKHLSWEPRSLGEKQELFSYLHCLLVRHIYHRGYAIRTGEVWRSDAAQAEARRRGASNVRRSLHQDKLAADLNLTLNGEYLTETEDHREFGEWWERLHPLCRWGGRFGDGNHYSLEHGGRR